MYFGSGDTSDLISMVSFTFVIPYSAGISAFLPPTVWQNLVGFRVLTSVCEVWQ